VGTDIVPTSTKGVEEPRMRVDLLLILLPEAEESLYWDGAFLSAFDLH
jgi:hypothetical protein